MTLHDFFLYAALLGGALFLVQLVLSAVGAGDADIDFGGHHTGGHSGTDHSSSDVAFKLLSLQGLSAFFSMFGLVGLALHDQTGLSPLPSTVGAFVGGWLMTVVIGRIFRAAKRLESSGTLDLKNAHGAEATVYLRIAPQKPGKVTVTVQGRQVEAEAISEDAVYETGDRVRVVRALPNGSVLVGRLLVGGPNS
ncbi:MAG: hypothetical protein RL701_2216 [Pseudomonadota bacterium]